MFFEGQEMPKKNPIEGVPSKRYAIEVSGDREGNIEMAAGMIAGDLLHEWQYYLLPEERAQGFDAAWEMLAGRSEDAIVDTLEKCGLAGNDKDGVLAKAKELFREKHDELMDGQIIRPEEFRRQGHGLKEAA